MTQLLSSYLHFKAAYLQNTSHCFSSMATFNQVILEVNSFLQSISEQHTFSSGSGCEVSAMTSCINLNLSFSLRFLSQIGLY